MHNSFRRDTVLRKFADRMELTNISLMEEIFSGIIKHKIVMKTMLALVTLSTVLLFSCADPSVSPNESAPSICGVKNPINQLDWLSQLIIHKRKRLAEKRIHNLLC
jgi:hypothetical protein